jgi:hypothetical protein
LDTETIRKGFRPNKIKILLIGESAPVGGSFFYMVDTLTHYTHQAFNNVFEETQRLNEREFLNFFKDKGFYLDDLCLIPTNKSNESFRNQVYEDSIDSLATRLLEYRPQVIIVFLKRIVGPINEAIQKVDLGEYFYYNIPFGGMGHQLKFISQLAEILDELTKLKII